MAQIAWNRLVLYARGQRSEVRSQRSEVRSERRRQKVRGQRSEVNIATSSSWLTTFCLNEIKHCVLESFPVVAAKLLNDDKFSIPADAATDCDAFRSLISKLFPSLNGLRKMSALICVRT